MIPHGHRLVIHGDKGTFHHGPLGSAYFFNNDPNTIPVFNNDQYPGTQKGDMLYSFIDCIIKGTKPDVTKNEVFEAMNISLAIEESLQKGKIIKVDYPQII